MTRPTSSTTDAAVGEDTTRPVILVYMGWDLASPDVNRYIACWASDKVWNSITWQASGAQVPRISPQGGQLILPNGDGDPWLALQGSQYANGRACEVYELQTDFTASPNASDATQIFEGIMDAVDITHRGIEIQLIEGLQTKSWPPTVITTDVYTHLPSDRDRLYWGNDQELIV